MASQSQQSPTGKAKIGGLYCPIVLKQIHIIVDTVIHDINGGMERRTINLNSKELNLVLALPFSQLPWTIYQFLHSSFLNCKVQKLSKSEVPKVWYQDQ